MINLSSFAGVDPTGARDTTAAIQAALASFGGQPTDFFVDGTYLVNPTGLTLPDGISLISNREGAGVFRAMAATYSNALLTAESRTGFYVGGVDFDFTSGVAAPQFAVVALVGCSDFEIEDCRIAGPFVFGIAASGITAARLKRVRIALPEPSTAQNEAILLTASAQSSNVKLVDCTCINSGIDVCMADSDIIDLDVSGWQFGAGITTEANAFCRNLNIIRGRIVGAPVTTGWNGKDANGVVIPGIENWAPHTRINGVRVTGCAGVGIANAGADSIISECFAVDNGLVTGAPTSNEGNNWAGTAWLNNVTI